MLMSEDIMENVGTTNQATTTWAEKSASDEVQNMARGH